MKPESGGIPIKKAVLVFSAAIVPFISWTRASWLEGMFSTLILLVFLLDTRQVIEEKKYRLPVVPVWIPLVILFLLSLYHLTRSPVPYASAVFIAHLSAAMAWYYVLLLYGEDIPVLPIILIWVVVLVLWMTAQKVWVGDVTPSGPFRNPNYTATVLLSCFGYVLGSFLYKRDRKGKAALALIASLSAGGLLLTGSRSAMLGMIILLGVAVVFGMKRIRWVAAVLIIVLMVIPTTVRQRVLEGYKKDPHAFTRVKIWKSAFQMGLDHPILGIGPNLFYDYGPQYAFRVEDLPVKYGRIARKPHNEYIRSWAEGGVVGLVAAGMFLCLLVRPVTRAWREERAGPVLAMGMIMFQAFFHDITEVFAPMLLGVWWLSHLTMHREWPVKTSDGKGRYVLTAAGVVLLAVTLSINIDGISRSLWLKGQKMMGSDVSTASKNLELALDLNPIHPGAARDLARVRLNLGNLSPTLENRSRAREAILRAKELNRLDTVPLRMEAALYTALARDSGKEDPELLGKALDSLEEAVSLEPYNALILFQQAEISGELGRREDALDLLERAIDLEPNYLEAHRTRIRYLAEIYPSMVPEAEKQLKEAEERVSGYRPYSDYEEIILR